MTDVDVIKEVFTEEDYNDYSSSFGTIAKKVWITF